MFTSFLVCRVETTSATAKPTGAGHEEPRMESQTAEEINVAKPAHPRSQADTPTTTQPEQAQVSRVDPNADVLVDIEQLVMQAMIEESETQ